jgi:poly(A) polymerase
MTEPLAAARAALEGRPAWVVGGSLRDALLGRSTSDVDLAVAGDVEGAARAVARAARAAVFPLSEAFGAWRVTSRDNAWQVDLAPLAGATIEEDLARRDFTVNAMGERLAAPGDVLDPHGGRADLAARRLRMVSAQALSDDPLRTLRAARIACELELEVEPATAAAVRTHAPGLARVSAERVWAELRRIVAAPDPVRGFELLHALALTREVLPELDALRGIGQGVYHHLDVYGHTLDVLARAVSLERDPEPALGAHAPRVAARLAAPLADELTGWGALRLGALLHDAGKTTTRRVFPNGKVGFPGHDVEGAALSRAVLARLRTSERLGAHVAALARHHLRLGFLVRERPISRRAVYEYLMATAPATVDVTVLTVADRLATRGRKADVAIAAHLELAHQLLGEVLAWEETPRAPLVRGDELAAALGIAPGPALGRALAELEAARFCGEVETPGQALAHARTWLSR